MPPKTTTAAQRKERKEHYKQLHSNKATSPNTAQKLYRSLHDQIDSGFLDNALKSADKILRLQPEDALAQQTKVQLLIALDRYPEALALLPANADALTRSYCLYKTGRELEARQLLAELDEDASEEPGVKVLEAQVNYRLEDYETARDGFDDLAAVVDLDSPELADLQTNVAACNAHIDFLSSVPSHLASSSAPAIENLETAPVAPLIHSNPLFKVSASAIASTSKSAATKSSIKPKAPRRLPKNYDPKVTPDPERWIPKRERPGSYEEIIRKREKARGRNKEKLMTQGSAADGPATPAKGSGGGGGGTPAKSGGGKKKKGKK